MTADDDDDPELDRHIDEVVARFPRMTPEQADRIRRLIGPGFYHAKECNCFWCVRRKKGAP